MNHESSESAEQESSGIANADLVAAREKVREARHELERAEAHFRDVRRKANDAEGAGHIATLGEVFDDMFALAKKYPVSSVAAAASVGFFLGRLFRR